MHKILMAGAAFAALSCATSTAFAAAACAKPQDVATMQTIDVQQSLMVSALNCEEIARYNAFQTQFHKELLNNDKALMTLMRRLKGAKGTAEYHAYKTKAANNAQLHFIADPVGYCASTKQALDLALAADVPQPSLTVLVSAQPIAAENNTYLACGVQMAAGGPSVVPVPMQKPVSVIEAQGLAMVTSPAAGTADPAATGTTVTAANPVVAGAAATTTTTAAPAPAATPAIKGSQD